MAGDGAFVDRLPALLESQEGRIAELEGIICLNAGTMAWAHRRRGGPGAVNRQTAVAPVTSIP